MLDPLYVWSAAIFIVVLLIMMGAGVCFVAKADAREDHDLAAKAESGLLKLGLTDEELEYERQQIRIIAEGECSSDNKMILKSLAKYSSRYMPTDIIKLCREMDMSPRAEFTLITDEHLVVSRKMDNAFMDDNMFHDGEDKNAVDKYIEVSSYAMNHIEDGRMILSIMYDRGIDTLSDILELMSLLKKSEANALAEGSL